ncbi:unnamed protein product [Lepeophtheirus salmonis]|uniref:(salmon louse) hypothetical protein n=1 Tax=Lepeophtheirus salmonis TaxID=72036 RepID=A0A7R8CLZ8_LEPSM|nr:unnamed protein product [Lepeophtheirus salmonis]CAF2827479.1 unnamed protein product [Lepeophtheirus salmonis]
MACFRKASLRPLSEDQKLKVNEKQSQQRSSTSKSHAIQANLKFLVVIDYFNNLSILRRGNPNPKVDCYCYICEIGNSTKNTIDSPVSLGMPTILPDKYRNILKICSKCHQEFGKGKCQLVNAKLSYLTPFCSIVVVLSSTTLDAHPTFRWVEAYFKLTEARDRDELNVKREKNVLICKDVKCFIQFIVSSKNIIGDNDINLRIVRVGGFLKVCLIVIQKKNSPADPSRTSKTRG